MEARLTPCGKTVLEQSKRIVALEADLAALRQERNEYRAANYNMIEDIRTLRAQLAAAIEHRDDANYDASLLELRARDAEDQLAAQAGEWQPFTKWTAPVHIAQPFPAVVQMSAEGDLFIAQPDADGVMSDAATVVILRLGPDHAFCRRVTKKEEE